MVTRTRTKFSGYCPGVLAEWKESVRDTGPRTPYLGGQDGLSIAAPRYEANVVQYSSTYRAPASKRLTLACKLVHNQRSSKPGTDY